MMARRIARSQRKIQYEDQQGYRMGFEREEKIIYWFGSAQVASLELTAAQALEVAGWLKKAAYAADKTLKVNI